jgi:hypothetical protein
VIRGCPYFQLGFEQLVGFEVKDFVKQIPAFQAVTCQSGSDHRQPPSPKGYGVPGNADATLLNLEKQAAA